ncbi:MAG: ROK family transcriptional regulator [Gemmatimonas sp.]|nr:ROK family transcriptional regulator [Gemmatimonas sp.]
MPRTPLADDILRLIWAERRISRAEIAQRLELSRSTVSELVDPLLASGLVSEAGAGASRGGRRPIVLEFQDSAFEILGVDMGASHVSVARMDLRGRILAWVGREFAVQTDPDGTRALIKELCAEAMQGVARTQLVGIGIAVPSPVDPKHPERLSTVALSAWKGVHGFKALLSKYRVPVMVDNDANCGALAEHWWGGAQGLSDFTYIKVATGIGAGHFIGGAVQRGASGVAGEIGHVAIDPRGELCVCGNRGCLTTLVGGAALVARAAALRSRFPRSELATGELTLGRIEQAALRDDALALQVVHEAAEHLGVAIAGVLNLLNPAAVILGGGLSVLGDRLLMPLRASALRRTFVPAVASTDIVVSTLGPRVVAIGAATLVLDAALRNPSLFPSLRDT